MINLRAKLNDNVSKIPYAGKVLTADLRPVHIGLSALLLTGCATTQTSYSKYGNTIYSKYGNTISEFDAKGNRVMLVQDINRDGKADRIWTWEYDARGNQTKQSIDDDANGTSDRIWSWEYDAKGVKINSEQDMNGDGIPNLIWTLNVAKNKALWDFDADGKIDKVDIYNREAR